MSEASRRQNYMTRLQGDGAVVATRLRGTCFATVYAVRLVFRVPAENDRGPQYMEQALAAIHQANPERLPLTLAFRRYEGHVTLACDCPDDLRAVVEGQL